MSCHASSSSLFFRRSYCHFLATFGLRRKSTDRWGIVPGKHSCSIWQSRRFQTFFVFSLRREEYQRRQISHETSDAQLVYRYISRSVWTCIKCSWRFKMTDKDLIRSLLPVWQVSVIAAFWLLRSKIQGLSFITTPRTASFIAQKPCNRPDIPWQLRCSGQR